MPAIHVYLDSSDFSILSDPKRRTDDLVAVLQQIRGWITEGRIVCCFSGTHLSEMSPLDSAYAGAAQRRADLLVDSCRRNALISQDRLFEGELRYALQHTAHLPVVHSPTGDWYPEGVGEIAPVGQLEIAINIRDAIQKLGLNRKARRMAEQKTLKRGKLRTGLQASIVANARTGSLDEVLDNYPMRPQDARTLGRYIVGDATREEAVAAFVESLGDPRWMMQWFEKHHDQLSPFIEWTRAPAASMIRILSQMAEHAATLRRIDAALGTAHADTLFSSSKWQTWQDELLLDIATRMSKERLGQAAGQLTTHLIDERCPGLSVGIRSLHLAWWTTTRHTPRKARLSDFPDALHAMYAPYVDVFRADSFMAPYIARCVSRFGTTVVPKLTDLPDAIRKVLEAKAGGI